MSYIMLPAVLLISKKMWLMLYLFFKVYILFYIFQFFNKAAYQQTAVDTPSVVCQPQCEKPCSTIFNCPLKLKYFKFAFKLPLSLYREKSTEIKKCHLLTYRNNLY